MFESLLILANILYLASYLVRDILWLRVLTVIAMLSVIPYYLHCIEDPRLVLFWQSLFLIVNLFQIALLIRERTPIALTEIEQRIYETNFQSLSPGEYRRLLTLARWREAEPGTTLVKDGEVVHEMLLLHDGQATVKKGDTEVARLDPGQFIGEMSFLTQGKASADVEAHGTAHLVSWPQEDLKTLLEKHADMDAKIRGLIGFDLVRKLKEIQPTSQDAKGDEHALV
jgi:hypothetical protein